MTSTMFDEADLLVDRAACTDAEPSIFFSDDMTVVQAAKQICAACPVREQCLSGALQREEPHGVWGGELFLNGVVIARKRPRGRPRKHPLPLDETVASPGGRLGEVEVGRAA